MYMKTTGIARKVDELGRIVIPKELRRVLDIDIKDPVEIFVDGESIILKKYQAPNSCMITGEVSQKNINLANGRIILSEDGAKQVVKEIKEKVKL
jgi:AbrB family transcriptional regulator, transcriptional pleiotropic regulator of transition state genes